MALPMLQSLDSGLQITWACDKASESLLKAIPQITNVLVVDHQKILRGSFLQKVAEVVRFWKMIFWEKYEKIILAHVDPRYRWLTALKKSQVLRSFSSISKIVPYRYMPYEYLRLSQGSLSYESQITFPNMRLPSCGVTKNYDVILAPGGNPALEPGKNLRSWPLDYYVKLSYLLLAQGKKISIVGSIHDQYAQKEFPPEIDFYLGSFSLPQLVDFYQKGKILVTHDSGPMHLGILSGISVLALFGPTIPAEKIPPYVHSIWGGEGLACRPCYDGKNYASCSNPLCMRAISPEKVLQKIGEIL